MIYAVMWCNKEECILLRFFDVVVCKIPAGRDTDTIIALPKKQACGMTKMRKMRLNTKIIGGFSLAVIMVIVVAGTYQFTVQRTTAGFI